PSRSERRHFKGGIHDARSSAGRARPAGPRIASRTPGTRRPRNHPTRMDNAARRGYVVLSHHHHHHGRDLHRRPDPISRHLPFGAGELIMQDVLDFVRAKPMRLLASARALNHAESMATTESPPIRLLIVDDDETLRETLSRRFSRQGMSVT